METNDDLSVFNNAISKEQWQTQTLRVTAPQRATNKTHLFNTLTNSTVLLTDLSHISVITIATISLHLQEQATKLSPAEKSTKETERVPKIKVKSLMNKAATSGHSVSRVTDHDDVSHKKLRDKK